MSYAFTSQYFEESQVNASNFATALSESKSRLAEALYEYVDLPKYVAPERPTRMPLASSWAELTRDRVLRNRLMELNQLSALAIEVVGPAIEDAAKLVERIDDTSPFPT